MFTLLFSDVLNKFSKYPELCTNYLKNLQINLKEELAGRLSSHLLLSKY